MNSKTIILLLIITFGGLINCSISDETEKATAFQGIWNVKNISGGINGMDDDYDLGIITWTFNTQNSTLTIANKSSESNFTIYKSGIYNYSILEKDTYSYLIIDDTEFGKITFIDQQLTLDQNQLSTGNGADGFTIKLER